PRDARRILGPLAAARRGARRLRPRRRLVRARVPRPLRLAGQRQPAPHRDPDPADPDRRPRARVRPVRAVPLDLALRRHTGRRRDRLRRRGLRGRHARLHGADPDARRLLPLLLPRRRAHLRVRGRRVAPRRARARHRCPHLPRPRRAPHADRRRRPHGPQPPPRAARDRRRARRRPRRRQPVAPAPPHLRRAGGRRLARARSSARPPPAGRRPRDDPRRAGGAARPDRPRGRAPRRAVPVRPPRDRPRPAGRARRGQRVTSRRSALDRFLAAVPYAVGALALLSLLAWQAAIRKSPTIFGDELEWTQISRAIAATGHAARRGEPIGFKSLYPYLIAPFWRIDSTSSAYDAIKYANTLLMALAAVPTYFLARLLVPARAAVVTALAVLCTTALYYAPFLLPEVAAFPAFALCAWVSVRALARGGAGWYAAAVVLDCAAPLVRGELVIVPASAAAAAIVVWLAGPQGTRIRRRVGVAGQVGAVVLAVVAFFVVNKLFGHHSHEWATVTHQWKDRLWTLGMESTSALALGLGLLPFLGGLASLWLPDRRRDPAWQAFAAFTAAALVTTWTYTGTKAAYLSTVFATRVEERNMIYVQPLLIAGTAAWVCARRRSLPVSLAAWAFTAWLVLHYGYQLDFPYFEAPGYGIAAMANRAFHWDQPAIRLALGVLCGVLLAIVLYTWLRPAARSARV